MSWLLKASQDADRLEKDQHWLRGDCFALIVAGRYVLPGKISQEVPS